MKPNGKTYTVTYENGQPIDATDVIEAGDLIYAKDGDKAWLVTAGRAAEMNEMIAAYRRGNQSGGGGSYTGTGDGTSGGSSGGTAGYPSGGGTTGSGTTGGSTNPSEEPDWIRMLGFDSGGVLKGIGGIKATREDELILPPDITKAILKPGLTNEVAERLNELGILTGARGVSTLKMNSGNSIGTQNNGDVYQLGGITLSQEQADVMTVSQLVGYASEFARALDLR